MPLADAIPAKALEQTTDLIAAMERAQSEFDILNIVLSYSGRFGATSIFAGVMPDAGQSRQQQMGHVLLNGLPAEWALRYFDGGYLLHDPTIRMVREQHAPFLWREIEASRMQSSASRAVMDEAGDFGLRDGLTLSLRTLEGSLIGFSFAGEHIELCDQDRDALRLVATFAVGRALQLRSSNRFAAQATITSRERQALQLAADGLRDQEIALRMGISRHGAEKHLRSVREKLQAKNTIKAIAISMRLGIIR